MTTTQADTPPNVARAAGTSEMLARRRKKRPALTTGLVLAILAAAIFVGGAEVQRHWGGSSSSSTRAATGLPSGFPGAGSGGGAAAAAAAAGAAGFPGAGSFGAAGSGTSGTVTLIKGQNLYVTDASGNTVLVHTSARSRVTKSTSSTAKAVHPGDSVTVTGTRGKDGSYTATGLTIGGSTSGG
jgi:hypothetical protein